MAILDLQKRLRQIATARYGELVTRNGKTFPSTRDTWRITTADHTVASQVADLFGGEVHEWDSKSAERYVVDTTTDRLPVAVIPGNTLSQFYELWSGGGCQRRCDGHEELITGGPCVCDPEQRECKPTTRLSFVLRGLDALGLVRLNTTGYYAAVELAGAVEFLERFTARGEAPAGWLRIEERRQVRDGQTKVFKVPVLDVQFGLDRMIPTAQQPALEQPAYTPLPAAGETGVTVGQGLEAAARQAGNTTTTARSAAPIGPAGDFMGDGPVPVPNDDGSTTTVTVTKPTQAQVKKLNVLVGKLREAGSISTDHLWAAMAKERSVDVDTMIELLEGRDTEGVLHWGPLRDSLTKSEATGLIDRLDALEKGAA